MEKPWIRFSKWPYEEAISHFVVEASDGAYVAIQEFYAYDSDLLEFAKKLTAFPEGQSDEVVFQAGKWDAGWAHWVSLRAYCYDAVGHGAIAVEVGNNQKGTFGRQAQFTIRSEVASINRMGQGLKTWLAGTEPKFHVELAPERA